MWVKSARGRGGAGRGGTHRPVLIALRRLTHLHLKGRIVGAAQLVKERRVKIKQGDILYPPVSSRVF